MENYIKKLEKLYFELNLNKQSKLGIDIVYYLLNPVFSLYYDIKVINKEFINKKISPIFYISRHYDEIDILCQQKISKEIRDKYPNYLVKKNLDFLNYFNFGVIPFYRGRDLKDKKINGGEYNKKVLTKLIPLLFANNQDFLIYPEGTRREGKRFKIQDKILNEMVNINNLTYEKYGISPHIISVDYKRDENDIFMRFGKPLRKENLSSNELKNYLYENINY